MGRREGRSAHRQSDGSDVAPQWGRLVLAGSELKTTAVEKGCVQPACLSNFRKAVFLLERWSRHAANSIYLPALSHLPARPRPWPQILSPPEGTALGTSLATCMQSAPEVWRPACEGGVSGQARLATAAGSRWTGHLIMLTAHTLQVCFQVPSRCVSVTYKGDPTCVTGLLCPHQLCPASCFLFLSPLS